MRYEYMKYGGGGGGGARDSYLPNVASNMTGIVRVGESGVWCRELVNLGLCFLSALSSVYSVCSVCLFIGFMTLCLFYRL